MSGASVTAIEGRNAVLEALRAGVPMTRVLVAEGTKPDRALSDIERLARDAGVRVSRVPRRELDRRSEREAHQGVLAEAAPFSFTPLARVLSASEGKGRSLIIALDQVTDPGNLGAIARTAEVVGADCVLTAKRRSAGVTPAAYKASAGALAHIAVAREVNLVRSLEQCKEAGYWIAGASEAGGQLVWDAPLDGRVVLVMGSEGEGLARLTRETCDFLVTLPQSGKVGSLNVAQATTAIAYEWLRRGTARA